MSTSSPNTEDLEAARTAFPKGVEQCPDFGVDLHHVTPNTHLGHQNVLGKGSPQIHTMPLVSWQR